MDNLTHSLVGLAAAKAGLERVSPGATALCVLAANAPDADILALVGGKWAYLHHHRGITHSIAGTLTLALLLPSLFYLGDLIVARIRRRAPRVKFGGLLLASLVVSATHPLMDWTNNYGVRPLLPWSSQWFYGDLVFIVDPWIWLTVGGAAFLLTSQGRWRVALWALLALVVTAAFLFMPLGRSANLAHPYMFRALWITGLAALVLAHRARISVRWGSSIALAALMLVAVYWGGLALLHQRAFAQAQAVSGRLAAEQGESLTRLAAMPTLANPLDWRCVADTERAVYRFDLSVGWMNEAVVRDVVRFEKPSGEAAALVAEASKDERAEIFLDFARFAVARVEGDCLSRTLVQFADIRYTEPGASRSGTFSLELPVECPQESVETSEK
ncbi:MAG: metal-dependent hydrolase [Pyrinomonadaceae bacterium]